MVRFRYLILLFFLGASLTFCGCRTDQGQEEMRIMQSQVVEEGDEDYEQRIIEEVERLPKLPAVQTGDRAATQSRKAGVVVEDEQIEPIIYKERTLEDLMAEENIVFEEKEPGQVEKKEQSGRRSFRFKGRPSKGRTTIEIEVTGEQLQ